MNYLLDWVLERPFNRSSDVMTTAINEDKPGFTDTWGPTQIIMEALRKAIDETKYKPSKGIKVRLEHLAGDVNMEIEVTW